MASVSTLRREKGKFREVKISAMRTVTLEIRGKTCIIDMRDPRPDKPSMTQQGTVKANELQRAIWALAHDGEIGRNGNDDWVYAINVKNLVIEKNEMLIDGPYGSGSIQMVIMSEVARSQLREAFKWAHKKIMKG